MKHFSKYIIDKSHLKLSREAGGNPGAFPGASLVLPLLAVVDPKGVGPDVPLDVLQGQAEALAGQKDNLQKRNTSVFNFPLLKKSYDVKGRHCSLMGY